MRVFENVMVIDDDPVLRAIIDGYFMKRGSTTVYHAANGQEALDVLASNPSIDLIVNDLNMPQLDGVELLRAFKTAGVSCPIVILSGTIDVVITMAEELAASLELNVVAAIRKPFTVEKMDEVLSSV